MRTDALSRLSRTIRRYAVLVCRMCGKGEMGPTKPQSKQEIRRTYAPMDLMKRFPNLFVFKDRHWEQRITLFLWHRKVINEGILR